MEKLDVSVNDLMRHPSSYCKSHLVQFDHRGIDAQRSGMRLVQTYSNWLGAWTAKHYEMDPGHFVQFEFIRKYGEAGRIGKGSGIAHIHNVTGKSTTADHYVRFLPWEVNCVTFMKVDQAARTFFT